LSSNDGYSSAKIGVYHKKWGVYCKPPFDGAAGGLQYLGRYTHRIAISNNRILTIQDGNVSFLWRDYADDNRQKTMALQAGEFIRRFFFMFYPLAMYGYAISACWQIETAKTTSRHAVSSSEPVKP